MNNLTRPRKSDSNNKSARNLSILMCESENRLMRELIKKNELIIDKNHEIDYLVNELEVLRNTVAQQVSFTNDNVDNEMIDMIKEQRETGTLVENKELRLRLDNDTIKAPIPKQTKQGEE